MHIAMLSGPVLEIKGRVPLDFDEFNRTGASAFHFHHILFSRHVLIMTTSTSSCSVAGSATAATATSHPPSAIAPSFVHFVAETVAESVRSAVGEANRGTAVGALVAGTVQDVLERIALVSM
jgi:hypothetical protein